MRSRSYLQIFIIVILLLTCVIAVSAGGISASHDSGAWGGPIYDWLEDEENVDRDTSEVSDIGYARPDSDTYDLSNPAPQYFSGGNLDVQTAVINEARQIIANDPDKDTLQDLDPEDGDPSTEEVIEALEYLDQENLSENRSWRFRDQSFEEPPVDDISEWNKQNYSEWYYTGIGYNEYPDSGSLVPEHRVTDTEVMEGGAGTILSNEDDWAMGLHTTIYSLGPSVWLMQDRDNETRAGTNDKVVRDNSKYVVGSEGTMRAIYSGQKADAPADTLPDNPQEGDVGIQYTFDSLTVPEDSVELDVPGYDVESEIETTEYKSGGRTSGIIYADWENTDIERSAGDRATFNLESTFVINYTAKEYEYEYDIDPALCEEDDDEEDGGDGGDNPPIEEIQDDGEDDDEDEDEATNPTNPFNPPVREGPVRSVGGRSPAALALGSSPTTTSIPSDQVPKDLPDECPAELEKEKISEWSIQETKEVSHSRNVHFASELFMSDDEPEERFDVTRAEFPSGPSEYHVEKDVDSTLVETGGDVKFAEPLQSVEIGSTTASTNWEYYSSRHHGWDDLVQRTPDESKNETVSRLKEYVYITEEDYNWIGDNGGGVYASRTRPLEMYAYPAQESPSSYSNVVVDEEETAVQPIEQFSSPALLAHNRCKQHYPDPQDGENYPWGNGNYNVEFCGWMFTAAGQSELPLEFHETSNQYNWRESRYPDPYIDMIKQESFHETYDGFSNNDEYYKGSHSMYDGMVVEKSSTASPDTVTINGILGQEEEVEVGETYEVDDSRISVTVERVSRGDNNISVTEEPIYGEDRFITISIKLEGIKSSPIGLAGSREFDAINTSERGDEQLLIETKEGTNIASEDQYIQQVQELEVDTIENGEPNPNNEYVESAFGEYEHTIYLVPPSDMNAEVDISYQACHWTEIKDDACGGVEQAAPDMYLETQEQVSTDEELEDQAQQRSIEETLFMIMIFLMTATFVGKSIGNVFNKNLNILRQLDSYIPSWVETVIVFGILLGIVLPDFSAIYLILVAILYSATMKI